jgi:cell division protein FtsA
MVDIGGGTTDMVAFKGGNVAFTAVIPVGGYQFTYDICQTYHTSYEAAEAAKLAYAHTEPYDICQTYHTSYEAAEAAKLAYAHTEPYVASPQEEVSLPLFDGGAQQKVPRRDLCQLTRERAQELIHLIKMKLQEADIGDVTKTRVVSTGGTSNLPGLQGLMQRILTNSVRIGIPDSHWNIPPELRAPHFATAVGILLWAREHGPSPVPATNGHSPAYRNGHGGIVSRFLRHVRNLWPVEVFLAKNGRIQWR